MKNNPIVTFIAILIYLSVKLTVLDYAINNKELEYR